MFFSGWAESKAFNLPETKATQLELKTLKVCVAPLPGQAFPSCCERGQFLRWALRQHSRGRLMLSEHLARLKSSDSGKVRCTYTCARFPRTDLSYLASKITIKIALKSPIFKHFNMHPRYLPTRKCKHALTHEDKRIAIRKL